MYILFNEISALIYSNILICDFLSFNLHLNTLYTFTQPLSDLQKSILSCKTVTLPINGTGSVRCQCWSYIYRTETNTDRIQIINLNKILLNRVLSNRLNMLSDTMNFKIVTICHIIINKQRFSKQHFPGCFERRAVPEPGGARAPAPARARRRVFPTGFPGPDLLHSPACPPVVSVRSRAPADRCYLPVSPESTWSLYLFQDRIV